MTESENLFAYRKERTNPHLFAEKRVIYRCGEEKRWIRSTQHGRHRMASNQYQTMAFKQWTWLQTYKNHLNRFKERGKCYAFKFILNI